MLRTDGKQSRVRNVSPEKMISRHTVSEYMYIHAAHRHRTDLWRSRCRWRSLIRRSWWPAWRHRCRCREDPATVRQSPAGHRSESGWTGSRTSSSASRGRSTCCRCRQTGWCRTMMMTTKMMTMMCLSLTVWSSVASQTSRQMCPVSTPFKQQHIIIRECNTSTTKLKSDKARVFPINKKN